MTGLPQSTFRPNIDLLVSLIHPDDPLDEITAALRFGHLQHSVCFRLVDRSGRTRMLCLGRVGPVPNAAEPLFWLVEVDTGTDEQPRPPVTPIGLPAAPTSGSWTFLDRRTGQIAVSGSMRAILGYASDERITAAQVLRRVAERDREAVAKIFASDRAAQEAVTVRFGFRRACDQCDLRLELTMTGPYPDPHGLPGRMGTISDITTWSAALDGLTRLRAMWDAALAASVEGIIVLEPGGRVIEMNARTSELLGPVLQPGASLIDKIPGFVGDDLWHFIRAQSGPDHLDDERWVPALDRWLAFSLRRIDGVILLTIRARDEVNRLRMALNDMTERCAAAMKAGGVMVVDSENTLNNLPFLLDEGDGRVQWADRPVLMGAEPPGGTGRAPRIPDEDLWRLKAAWREAQNSGETVRIPFRCATEAGERSFVLRGAAAPASGERPRRFAGCVIETSGPDMKTGETLDAAVSRVLTPGQVRAARGALNWSVRELAEKSGVSVATINRFEGDSGAVSPRVTSIDALQRALSDHGVEFLRVRGKPAITLAHESRARDGLDAPQSSRDRHPLP